MLLALTAGRLTATSDPARTELEAALAMSRVKARATERAVKSVVAVRALGDRSEEIGAGVIVGRDGAVLTAHHVVAKAGVIAFMTHDGVEHPAEVVAHDARADLALLRPKTAASGFEPAIMGDDEATAVGETVLVVANPFGLRHSVSCGVLSARERRAPGNVVPLLQTDAPINPGSSGGALVNLRGEVIGLITAILTTSGRNTGIGFALPARELRHAVPYLKAGEPVQRAWLGVRVTPRPGSEPGLEIVSLTKGGPAQRAGLKVGDIILRIAGQRLEVLSELRWALRATRVGQPVRLSFRRESRLLNSVLVPAQKNT
ncbi:MAG: S1C family serine protease [Planctomycetota bacterium]